MQKQVNILKAREGVENGVSLVAGCLLYLPSPPRSALPAPPPLPRVSLISVIDLAGDFIRILLIASKVQFLNPYKAALSSEQASERASPGLV